MLRFDLALVTVTVELESVLQPTFEQPNGYTFSVKEGEVGLTVGFVKVFTILFPAIFICNLYIAVEEPLCKTVINLYCRERVGYCALL